MDPEIVERLNEQLREMSEILGEQNSMMAAQIKAMKGQIDSSSKLESANEELVKSVNNVAKKHDSYVIEQQQREKAQKEIQQALDNAISDTRNALVGLAKTIMSTEKGFTKYASGVGELGDVAWDLGKKFGPLGVGIGATTKAFTVLAESVLKQVDAMNTYGDVWKKVGAIGGMTNSELTAMARSAGYASDRLDRLNKPIQTLGTAIINLGGTSQAGQDMFMKMINLPDEVKKRFDRLGLQLEDVNDAQAQYVRLQRLSGNYFSSSIKDQERLKKSSLEYTENLLELAALTGQDVDKIKVEQEKAQREYQELILTRAENAKIDSLRRQINSTEDATLRARLQGELEGLERQKSAREIIKQQSDTMFGEELGQGIRDYIRSGRVSEENIGAFQLLGPQLQELRRLQQSGASEQDIKDYMTGPMADAASKRANELSTSLERAITVGDTRSSQELGERFGLFQSFLEKVPIMSDQTRTQARDEARDQIARGGSEGFDAAADARASLNEFERDIQTTIDNIVDSLNPLSDGFSFAAAALAAFTAAAVTGAGILTANKLGIASLLKGRLGILGRLGGVLSGAAPAATGAARFAGMAGMAGKVAVGGGLLGSGLMVGKDAFDVGSSLVKGEEAKGEDIGGVIGGVLGGAVGLLGGPLGVAIGAGIGNMAGNWIGSMFDDDEQTDNEDTRERDTTNNQQERTQPRINDAQYQKFEQAVEQFGRFITVFGRLVTSSAKLVTANAKLVSANAKLTKAFATSVKTFNNAVSSLSELAKVPSTTDRQNYDTSTASTNISEPAQRTTETRQPTTEPTTQRSESNREIRQPTIQEGLFNRAVVMFGRYVSGLSRIVTMFNSAVGTFKEPVTAQEGENNIIAALNNIASLLQDNLPKRASRGLLGTPINSEEDEDLLDYIDRLKNSLKDTSINLDTMREAEIKRHTFNEISMRQFRMSVDAATEKLDKLAGRKTDEEDVSNDTGAPGGESPGGVTPTPGVGTEDGSATKVTGGGAGYTNLQYDDGREERRTGTLAWRNNNPGNIRSGRFARSMGAIGSSGGFAVFPTYEQGRRAKEELLFNTDSYKNRTIAGAINRYAPSSENDTRSYINSIVRAVGVNSNTPLRDLTPEQRRAMLDAMERVEGFRPGRVEVLRPGRGGANTPGDLAQSAGPGSERIVELGRQLQSQGFVISGHTQFGGRPARGVHAANSRHYRDLAIDINAPGGVTEANDPRWKDRFNDLAVRIQRAGFAVKWNDDSAHKNHIHASVGRPEGRIVRAAQGGVFDGPSSGYPAELHGSEMVAPLDTNSVLMKLAKTPADVTQPNALPMPTSIEKETIEKLVTGNQEMLDVMIRKLEDMVSAINDGNDTREKIFKNTVA